MLHILLLILKIIGVTLAIILGVLLLTICLVLFVPVRYRIQADGRLGGDEPFHVKIRISWLLHIINVLFSYPNEAGIRLRILLFTVFDSSKPRKTKAENNSKKKSQKKFHKETEKKYIEPPKAQSEDIWTENNRLEAMSEEVIPEEVMPPKDREEKKEEETLKEGLWEKLRAFFLKIKIFFQKLLNIIKNIEYTIVAMYDKIKKIIENIGYYTEVLQGEVFKEAFGVSKKKLLRIIKNVRPRKCDIRLTIGTGDPASTGQILAIYGMIYPFIGNNVIIQADFENKIAEGSLDIKGKISFIILFMTAFQIYRNKNIRHLLKLLKREES
ncbi:MAG: DUF2953 domain-containing protein [Clostridiales bacterium]|nr:DUF2953 domain-containing protein [Clostridiales bacterium]